MAHADRGDRSGERRICTNDDVAGDWAFSQQGTLVGVGPGVGVGIFHIDRDGNINGTQTIHINGVVQRLVFPGTYHVNPDCTGEAEFEGDPDSGEEAFGTISFVVVPRVGSMHVITTTPGRVSAGRAERLHR